MSGAETVTCARCGGAVPMQVLAAAVSCPYCKSELRLSADDLARLARYRADVSGKLGRANEQLGYAESWNRWYGGAEARRKNNPFVPIAIWLVLVVVIGGFAGVVQNLGLDARTLGVLAPFGSMGLFVLVIGAYMFWYYSGRSSQRKAAPLAAAPIHCPKCGAPNQLAPGEVLRSCRYCSAPLMPGETVMQHGRAEAERALIFAEIERSRAERRGMVNLSSSSLGNATPYIIFGSFVPITAIGAVAFTVSWLSGNERDANPMGILVLWALATANVGLLALVYVFRRYRQGRVDGLVGGAARALGGATLADVWAMNGWLDRHWAGSVPYQQVFRGPYFASVEATIESFPVLVVVNPVGASEHYPPFVAARVGAWVSNTGAAERHPAVAMARATCGEAGFELRVERAGLLALAVHGAAKRVVRSGSSERIVLALRALTRAARELGATPVDIAPS